MSGQTVFLKKDNFFLLSTFCFIPVELIYFSNDPINFFANECSLMSA